MQNNFFAIFKATIFALIFVASSFASVKPEPDTLVFWVMDQGTNTGNSLQKLTRKFYKETGSFVKIEFLDWGSAFENLKKKLRTTANEKKLNYPDVLQLGSSWVPYFAKENLIATVDDLVDVVDTSRFFAEAMKASHVGKNKIAYSLPWFLDVRGMFANERLWKEFELTEDEMDSYPKFFGMIRAVANAKYKNDNDSVTEVTPFEFGINNDWTGFQQMAPILWNFGGDFLIETKGKYRSSLVDSLTLVGLAHYFKFLKDIEVSPHNLYENSSDIAERFIAGKQLMIFGTSELIRKMKFDESLGGLKNSPLASDGLIAIPSVKGPAGNFTFVGGSHLTLPKNANSQKRNLAKAFFAFMLRADNLDYYSRHSGFVPADKGLIRIWMKDLRYRHLINELEISGRSCQNIPEWTEVEMLINKMVNGVGEILRKDSVDINSKIAAQVFETHKKINATLNYKNKENSEKILSRITSILNEEIIEEKFNRNLGNVVLEIPKENSTNFYKILAGLGFVIVIFGVLFFRKKKN